MLVKILVDLETRKKLNSTPIVKFKIGFYHALVLFMSLGRFFYCYGAGAALEN